MTLAVLQLASGGPDVSRLVAARETTPAATTRPERDDGGTDVDADRDTAGCDDRPQAAGDDVEGAGDDVGSDDADEAVRLPHPPPRRRRSPRRLRRPPAPARRPRPPPGFKPTRNWAWAPVKDATYYDVVFTRQGAAFYRGTPTVPRLTLPASVVFRPGAYRWVVRPGFGDRAAKNLGAPVVDSPFTVS